MKCLITIISVLFLCNNANGQQKSSVAQDSSISAADLSNLTVMLYQPVTNTMGTGTVIKHKNKYYLLTANHVAVLMENSAKIIFHLGNDQPGIIDLAKFTKGKHLNWIHHPIADLSIMELVPYDDNSKLRLSITSFPSSWIVPDTILPTTSLDFTYLGFPVIELDMKHFSPLIFNAHGASGLITQTRLDNKEIKCDFYYLDKPSMQGCSGSGVYISVKNNSMYMSSGKTYLLGVVHGTQGDNTGGKLAMITPAYYIYDLLKEL